LVDKMLDLAKVTPKDYVIDLGSGDGRTVITAAKLGAKALGVEYNPDMVELSRRNADKAGVGDIRDSPALEIIEALQARGALLDYADPRVPQVQVGGHLLKSIAWEQADLAAYDLVLLLTAHPEFDPRRLVAEARLVVDTRNATGGLGELRHVVRI